VAQVWETAKGIPMQTLTAKDTGNITSVAFSHDGSIALTGYSDGVVRLWNVRSGQVVSSYDCGPGNVLSAAFSASLVPLVFAGCADGTVKIWDAKAQGFLRGAMASFVDGGWAVLAPGGRFDSDRFGIGPTLSWVSSAPEEALQPLPIEAFARDYYTPRAIAFGIFIGPELTKTVAHSLRAQ